MFFYGKRALTTKKLSRLALKYYFRTILALVAHFDLGVHHIEEKIVFINGDIEETIYTAQPENFVPRDPK